MTRGPGFDDDRENPYAPPTPAVPFTPDGIPEEEGSFGLGVVLGLLLGLWGLLGCHLLAKYETKRGAKYGFLCRIALTVVVAAIVVAIDAL